MMTNTQIISNALIMWKHSFEKSELTTTTKFVRNLDQIIKKISTSNIKDKDLTKAERYLSHDALLYIRAKDPVLARQLYEVYKEDKPFNQKDTAANETYCRRKRNILSLSDDKVLENVNSFQKGNNLKTKEIGGSKTGNTLMSSAILLIYVAITVMLIVANAPIVHVVLMTFPIGLIGCDAVNTYSNISSKQEFIKTKDQIFKDLSKDLQQEIVNTPETELDKKQQGAQRENSNQAISDKDKTKLDQKQDIATNVTNPDKQQKTKSQLSISR
jgi:hypothetical protein